jgi:hypothetical protein
MFQSIWTIFREPTLVLAKVILFQIFTIKMQCYKIFSVVVQAVCGSCAVRSESLTLHSTGYTHSLNHNTENLLTLHFNGKNLKKNNFSKDQRGLPEDGPYGLEHVGANMLNKLFICWSKKF